MRMNISKNKMISGIRRAGVLLLTGILLLSAPVSVLADREDAVLDKPYLSLGADLTETEKAKVLELLGVDGKDLSGYTVTEITNADEHKYLDSYLSSSIIGSRALSSVLVVGKESGYGIKVTTKNISYCTVGMYQNALATAGIQDADITVAGPFEISGTAGLVGAIKSYENMTGETVKDSEIDAATNELVTTSELGNVLNDPDTAEQLVGFIKNEVVEKDLSESEINDLITKAAEEFQVELSDEDRQKIADLMEQIKGLDLDVNALKEQVSGLYDKLKGLDIQLTDEQKGFLSDLFNRIVEFFTNLFR